MSNHETALEILIASRQKYLQSAISLIRKARVNKNNSAMIIKHANDFHRAKAKSLLQSIKVLREHNSTPEREEHCACCMNTGYIKGTNEYEQDVLCPICRYRK